MALSRGWSLLGKNWCANHGCGAVAEPSGVMKNAFEAGSSPGTVGAAVKCVTLDDEQRVAAHGPRRRDHELLAVAGEPRRSCR